MVSNSCPANGTKHPNTSETAADLTSKVRKTHSLIHKILKELYILSNMLTASEMNRLFDGKKIDQQLF